MNLVIPSRLVQTLWFEADWMLVSTLSSVVALRMVQWNESSKATSGGAFHGLINFFEIPPMAELQIVAAPCTQ